MKRFAFAMIVAAIIFMGMQAAAQDMRWTTQVTEVIPQRGGRRGGPQPADVTRVKTVTVIMKATKTTVDGTEVLLFKHSPIKDQSEEDAAKAEIPWSEKEALTEALKTVLADMKKPSTGQQSERKQVYKSPDGSLVVKGIFEGHSKSVEVTLQNAKKANVDFTLPLQQVEVFFRLLRNMK